MKNKKTDSQAQNKTFNQTQGLVTDIQVFTSGDGNSLIHRSQNLRIELPINLYKAIFGMNFDPQKREHGEKSGNTPSEFRQYGALIRNIPTYLSKDGHYLIHRVFGMRICKHVNFYRAILGLPKIPSNNPQTAGSQVA